MSEVCVVYLVLWINFDSVLKYVFWIRYPSKSDCPADLYNNHTAPLKASQELRELLQRGQYLIGRCTCRDCSPLLLRMRCVLQDQNWVKTMLALLNYNGLTSFPSTGEGYAAPRKQLESW